MVLKDESFDSVNKRVSENFIELQHTESEHLFNEMRIS